MGFGDDLPKELKKIKKFADALNDSGKQKLVCFLQSRMKPMSAPIRAIDEIVKLTATKGGILRGKNNIKHSIL